MFRHNQETYEGAACTRVLSYPVVIKGRCAHGSVVEEKEVGVGVEVGVGC